MPAVAASAPRPATSGGSPSQSAFESRDESLLHRSIRSASTRARQQQAGLDEPTSDEIVQARMRGRREATHDAATAAARARGRAGSAARKETSDDQTMHAAHPTSSYQQLATTSELNRPPTTTPIGLPAKPAAVASSRAGQPVKAVPLGSMSNHMAAAPAGQAYSPRSQVRRAVHSQAQQQQRRRSSERPAATSTQAAAPSYDVPPTQLPLPAVPAHVTAWSVFEWFADVLQLDLLAALRTPLPADADLSDPACMERQSFQSDRHSLPVPSTASPFWLDLSSRFSSGVLPARIASTLQGESVQGVQLQPRNAAARKVNWTGALATLCKHPYPSEGRGYSPRHSTSTRTTTSTVGDGTITLDLLYGLSDVAAQHGMHPAILWNMLATIYAEYSPIHRERRDWTMEPTDATHDQEADGGDGREPSAEAEKENRRSSFGGGSAAFRPVPSPASGKARARSASRERSPKNAILQQQQQQQQAHPATPTKHATAAGFSKYSPAMSTRSIASTSLALHARERSASPSIAASDYVQSEKEYGATSSAPLDEMSYARLQHLVHQVTATSRAIDAAARTRPVVFQPKSHQRRAGGVVGGSGGSSESFRDGGRLKSERPDRAGGDFYGPAGESTQHPGEQASATEAFLTQAEWDEQWPPVIQVDPIQEKCVREWLASELGLYVLPSQEFAASPLDDPFRNGTLLCDLATKFRERFLAPTTGPPAASASAGRGVTSSSSSSWLVVPSKRKPTILMSVLENVIRGLTAIREALQYRQQQRAMLSPSFLPTRLPSTFAQPAPRSFALQLASLSPRMESVVDGMVKGDPEVVWGVLWHLWTEWTVDQEEATPSRHTTESESESPPPKHNAGWTDRERMLLQWIQKLGVGVGIGVVDDSNPDPFTAAEEMEEAKQADLTAHLRGGASRGRQLNSSVAPSNALLPTHSQVGLLQFVQLFRKGVLLCDLTAATAGVDSTAPMATSTTTPSVRLTNVVRDPRTWKVCRQNLEKALGVLSIRPRMSLHLFRGHTQRTLDALADGDRTTIMALINDIYTCYQGEVPHACMKDCMGRAEAKRAKEEEEEEEKQQVRQRQQQQQQPQPSLRRPAFPSPRMDALATTVLPQPQPQPQPQLSRTLPRAAGSAKKKPRADAAQVPTSAAPMAASSTQAIDSKERLDVTMPKLVHEVLMLHDWLRSLLDLRTLSPAHLLTEAEQRAIPPAHHAQLGIGPARDASGAPPEAAPFSSGLLLCDLVGCLTHTRLRGVVTQPTAQQKKSRAAQRAVAIHNLELALTELRKIQRMPLTHLYRETANAIVQNEQERLRALLIDIRSAFPASLQKRAMLHKTEDGRGYE